MITTAVANRSPRRRAKNTHVCFFDLRLSERRLSDGGCGTLAASANLAAKHRREVLATAKTSRQGDI